MPRRQLAVGFALLFFNTSGPKNNNKKRGRKAHTAEPASGPAKKTASEPPQWQEEMLNPKTVAKRGVFVTSPEGTARCCGPAPQRQARPPPANDPSAPVGTRARLPKPSIELGCACARMAQQKERKNMPANRGRRRRNIWVFWKPKTKNENRTPKTKSK